MKQNWVLVGNVSPEHSLNKNSNLIQAMFIVCSEYIRCHTSFILHSCSVRIFKKNSGSVQTLVTLSSAHSGPVQTVVTLCSASKKTSEARDSHFKICSGFVQTRGCLWASKTHTSHIVPSLFTFTICSFSVQIQSLFVNMDEWGSRATDPKIRLVQKGILFLDDFTV